MAYFLFFALHQSNNNKYRQIFRIISRKNSSGHFDGWILIQVPKHDDIYDFESAEKYSLHLDDFTVRYPFNKYYFFAIIW